MDLSDAFWEGTMFECSAFHLLAFFNACQSFYDYLRQLPVAAFSVRNLFTGVIWSGKSFRFLKVL